MSKRIEITRNDSPLDPTGYVVSEIDENAHQGVMTTIKTKLDSVDDVLGAVRFILRRGMSLLAEPMKPNAGQPALAAPTEGDEVESSEKKSEAIV